jgi:P-type Cu2+ transporter
MTHSCCQHPHDHSNHAISTSKSSEHHDKHGSMLNDILKRFIVSLLLTFPILLLSPMIQKMFGFHLFIPGGIYILLFLASIVYFFAGQFFLQGLYQEIRDGNPGMMTLIGLAITVAYFYSTLAIFGLAHEDFFLELVALIDIMLLGHWIEMKSVMAASNALELLVKLLPQTAHSVSDNKIIDVNLDTIKKGDILLIKPGEKIPSDGLVIEGMTYVNESLLTGESAPIKKIIHDKVIGGSINGNGSIKVKVEQTGSETYLAKVIDLVKQAHEAKSKTQGLADQAAKWLTIVSVIVGLLALVIWLVIGKDFSFAFERMVTVLVISCPCALGLAVPLVVAISTAIAAQRGILIRNRSAFENARKITTLVFDKTGTVTEGNFNVINYDLLNASYTKNELLKMAASVELHSEHPIALGIVRLANESNVEFDPAINFNALTGYGVTAQINGNNIKIVGSKYLNEYKIDRPQINYDAARETIIFVLKNDTIIGYFTLADKIRDESFAAVKNLRNSKIKTIMLTGDKLEVAQAVSNAIGIDNYYAEVLPHQKLEIIQQLQQQGEFVAMAGDGVNDAPALAQANIGIAIGSGTDIAAESADIILVHSELKNIATIIKFGKATYRKIVQNLIWAAGYNVITIPLAAGALSYYKIGLSPIVGAILMSLSSVIVSINAQLLKRQMGASS